MTYVGVPGGGILQLPAGTGGLQLLQGANTITLPTSGGGQQQMIMVGAVLVRTNVRVFHLTSSGGDLCGNNPQKQLTFNMLNF